MSDIENTGIEETTGAVVKSAEVLAAEIRAIKTETSAIISACMAHAGRSVFEIGKRLCELKNMIPHGEWGNWLDANVQYKESTAQDLMRIYKEYGSEQYDMITGKAPVEIFEKLGQSQLVALFPLPAAKRAEFVGEHPEISDMSVREIKELVRKTQELEAKIRQDEENHEREIKSREDCIQEEREAKSKAFEDLSKAHGDILSLREKSEAERKKLKDKAEKLKKELEEIKNAEPATIVSHEPDEETLERIKREAEESAKAKAEKEMKQLRMELDTRSAAAEATVSALESKVRAAEAKADPVAAEINAQYKMLFSCIESIKCNLDRMSGTEPEKAEKLKGKIAGAIHMYLEKAGLGINAEEEGG